jgi:hypothetical protein
MHGAVANRAADRTAPWRAHHDPAGDLGSANELWPVSAISILLARSPRWRMKGGGALCSPMNSRPAQDGFAVSRKRLMGAGRCLGNRTPAFHVLAPCGRRRR